MRRKTASPSEPIQARMAGTLENRRPSSIAHQRLSAQGLAGAPFATAAQVVRWLGAVQAQDSAAAKWAVALRTRGATDADVERALDSGAILRTHVLRPTWHLVMPADIRWMLALTAPRVNAACAGYYRKLALDDATFARSQTALVEALRGGNHLTRPELAQVLERAKVGRENLRLAFVMMRAELDGVICSGPRRGKQLTYALLDERVPAAPPPPRGQALAELAARYFTSHGPARVQDFAWWSGLTVADAKTGVESVRPRLAEQEHGGATYWFAPAKKKAAPALDESGPVIHLLPNYDEFLVAYKDRSASVDATFAKGAGPRGDASANNVVVMNGKVVGVWRRTFEKTAAAIETKLLVRFGKTEMNALRAAAERYGHFVGLPVRLSSSPASPP
jgi:hypothetical protein